MRLLASVSLAALLLGCVPILPARGVELPRRYPRIANYYLAPRISAAEAAQLARWDIVILGIDTLRTSPEIFSILREKNPGVIILAYVLSEEFPAGYETETDPASPVVQLRSGISDSWWLRDAAGEKTGFWPGAGMLNVTNTAPAVSGKRWNTYLPEFVQERVFSTNLWDGVFFDNVFNDVAWVNGGDIDTNNDHIADTPELADAAWRDGMRTMLQTMRRLAGPEMIILGNGGGQYYPEMNGRLIEEFPSDLDGAWSGAMKKYADVMKRGLSPAMVVVNGKANADMPVDYQRMRYLLASTLMEDGFFSFDEGAIRHHALWRFDEYDAYLGLPLGNAERIWPKPAGSYYEEGVWRRDFHNGVVLVNSTDQPQTIELGAGYEELRGLPAVVNGGRTITRVELPGHDGRIFLRRQRTIDLGGFVNGSFVQILKNDLTLKRSGFRSYTTKYKIGRELLMHDFDRDGRAETVRWTNGRVWITNFRDQIIATFYPFGKSYLDGISAAAGDFNGDGVDDLVFGSAGERNQRIVGTTLRGRPLFGPWRPFRGNYGGGISVAAADVTQDGIAEVIAGAGKGADPRVSVFSRHGRRIRTFLALDRRFRGGVRVAAGDLTGDGLGEIVVVPRSGGGPFVQIYKANGRRLGPGRFVLKKNYRAGLYVSIDDIDHMHANLILISGPG